MGICQHTRKIKCRANTSGGVKAFVLGACLLVGATSVRIYAQTDTLITNSGEVLTGRYNKPVFGHSGFTVNGKKQPLDAGLYKAYSHEGTWYESVRLSVTADPVWMQCLERGAITLYQYIAYGQATRVSPRNLPESYVVWLASKARGPLLNVNGVMSSEPQAKDNLHRLLADRPELAGELDNAPFTLRTVRGLIGAYNKKAADSSR